jgi:WS/DGAT/MGAT family acyltransferase
LLLSSRAGVARAEEGMARTPVAAPRRRMSSRDAGFLYLERPSAGLHIGCVAVLDGPLARDELVARVAARLPRLRRYAQRATPVPLALGHPTWEDDPDFDVQRHVRRWALPAPGGDGELAEMVGALLAQPLDRERPLWEMHLLEGLDGGRSAIFQKVHHCMVDGLAGAQLLEALLDPTPDARDTRSRRSLPLAPLPAPAERAGRALLDGALGQLRLLGGTLAALSRPSAARDAAARLRDAAWSALQLAAGEVPEMPWNARVGASRRVAFTRLPMATVRRIRESWGGTVNDVVLSVLAGGLHHYLVASGFATRGLELIALVPVSLRDAHEASALGNRISGMLVPLCVDVWEERPRLAATRAITERLKASAAWTGIDALLAALDELPAPLVALFGAGLRPGRLANVIATNVPGPRETRWLAGRRVEALQPIVPIIDGIGLGLAVFSYDGWLHVGLNADAALVPDLEKLRHGIEAAFARLAQGA